MCAVGYDESGPHVEPSPMFAPMADRGTLHAAGAGFDTVVIARLTGLRTETVG